MFLSLEFVSNRYTLFLRVRPLKDYHIDLVFYDPQGD